MSTIEIKPEAPWIRRSDQGVIFTDDVVKDYVELSQSFSSEEEASYKEEEEYCDSNEDELFEEDPRVSKWSAIHSMRNIN